MPERDTPRRRLIPLPTRDFETDLLRLQGSQEAQTQMPLGPGAVRSSEPTFRNFPSITSGPRADRIAGVAEQLAQNSDTRATGLYNPSGPTVACASFVSTVLQQAGIFPQGRLDRLDGINVRAVVNMPPLLTRTGGVLIYPRDTPITEQTVRRLARGDVILFHKPGVIFHHTGIYVGNGKMVDTSSSRRLVVFHDLVTYPSYHLMSVFRYSG